MQLHWYVVRMQYFLNDLDPSRTKAKDFEQKFP